MSRPWDHHGRAAHDGGVDGRKAAADALEEAREIVIHTVEGLNTQEHKEQRQEECDDGAEGGSAMVISIPRIKKSPLL